MTKTSSLIFVHMPKTGGSWVSKGLLAERGGKRHSGHSPAWSLVKPTRKRGLIIGNVRNPWNWYGSLYCHAKRNNRGDYLRMYGNGKDDFRSVLYGLTHPSEATVPEAIGIIISPVNGYGGDRPFTEGGLYTYIMKYMYKTLDCKQWIVHTLVDTDHLTEYWGFKHEPANIGNREVYTPRAPDCYSEWYDDEMIEWVREADKDMITLFGYEPFKEAKQATFNFKE